MNQDNPTAQDPMAPAQPGTTPQPVADPMASQAPTVPDASAPQVPAEPVQSEPAMPAPEMPAAPVSETPAAGEEQGGPTTPPTAPTVPPAV